jgi:N-acetylglucosaminyl-diphospho-decaprenol L-rhamnosyltransferase
VTEARVRNDQLGIVIVNYRSPQLTIRCISSILDTGVAPLSAMTVVDNASGDDSPAQLKSALFGLDVLECTQNRGFSAGVNAGCGRRTEPYLMVLNPDTFFRSNVLPPVVGLMEERWEIGIVGLDLVNPDGARQYSARRFYTALDIIARRGLSSLGMFQRRIDRHLLKEEWEKGTPFEADWVMGTGFVTRRSAFVDVGSMDEDYFLYMEDVDLCARMWAAGHSVVGFPGAVLVHDHQRASARPLSRSGRAHIRSLLRFSRKFPVPLLSPPQRSRPVLAQVRMSSDRI